MKRGLSERRIAASLPQPLYCSIFTVVHYCVLRSTV